MNTDDNDGDNDEEDKKKLACIQLGEKMSFERNDHTCKNASRLVLNFCTTSLSQEVLLLFYIHFRSLFLEYAPHTQNGRALWRLWTFLRSCDNCTVFKKIGCGVEFTVTNAMAFSCSSSAIIAKAMAKC